MQKGKKSAYDILYEMTEEYRIKKLKKIKATYFIFGGLIGIASMALIMVIV